MSDQEPHTGPPTREARKTRELRDPHEARKRRKSRNSEGNTLLGLKSGLLAGVTDALKFWISFFTGVLGLFVVIGILFSFTIEAGIFTTEGTGAWVVFLSWLGSVWLFGQWLKARFGRSNKIFRER